MPRPKKTKQEQFQHLIRVRVNDAIYELLITLQKQADCRSIYEMARKILSGERINLFHKDASLSGPMEELWQKGVCQISRVNIETNLLKLYRLRELR